MGNAFSEDKYRSELEGEPSHAKTAFADVMETIKTGIV